MPKQADDQFGFLRRILWPVHTHELKKLVPMLLIFFLISFDYNVLRTLKDALIVTAKSSGAEVIPFIKVWVMLPSAVLLTMMYAKFMNHLDREKVFYAMMGVFLTYFFIFITLLYPNRESIHLHSTADFLKEQLPEGFSGLISMIRYWSFTTFYVMAELWGTMLLFTLFWGFANEVTRVDEAKRFYGLFGIGANFSGFAVGMIAQLLIRVAPSFPLPFYQEKDDRMLFLMLALVLIFGLVAVGLFRWLNVAVIKKSDIPTLNHSSTAQKEKLTLSLGESFSYILKSPYLLAIASIVLTYNIVINLLEVIWKAKVKELYPTMEAYSNYMYEVTWVMGLVATLIALFVSGNSIRNLGWTFTALLTPVVLFTTSILFFFFIFAGDAVGPLTESFLQLSPLAIVVFLGTTQNILSRACKYSVFDATKELAFVPLSSECKLKGKAAIDGVCSRMGKSAGSVIHQSLLITFGSLTTSAPYVALALLGSLFVWIAATRQLGERFTKLTQLSTPATEEIIFEEKGPLLNSGNDLAEQKAV